jgi:tetratricopeptide (TPR) repeat protein
MYEEPIKKMTYGLKGIKKKNIKLSKKLVELGIELVMKKEFNHAIEYFNDAIKLNPYNKNAYINKGRALISIGNHQEGIKCYEIVIELESSDNLSIFNNSDIWKCIINNKDIESVSKKNKNDYDNYMINLLNLDKNIKPSYEDIKKNNRYERIVTICDDLLQKDPNNIDLLIKKSMALGLNNEYELAINCCNKILNQNPFNFKSLKNKAYFLTCINQNEAALECYNEAIKINPSNIDCYFGKGIILDRLGKHNDAIECFNKIIDIDPTNRIALINKIVTLGKLNKNEDAFECYKKILELKDQENSDTLSSRVRSTYDLDDFDIDDLFQDLDFDSTIIPSSDKQFEIKKSKNINEFEEKNIDITEKVNYGLNYDSSEMHDEKFIKDFHEHMFEITEVMKILKKQGGGSFYYVVEPVDLFKVSILILETLINKYNMDGIIICLEKPPKYFQMILNKKCNKDSKLFYINTLSNLVINYNYSNNDIIRNNDSAENFIYNLNSENLNLEHLTELIELCMQRLAEKYCGENHFILFDNIAGLEPYYSLDKIKDFSDKFGVRLNELNLYGIVMAPKGKINVKITDIIKAIPSIVSNKIKKRT